MRYVLITIGAFSIWMILHYTINEFYLGYLALEWQQSQFTATSPIPDHPWLKTWYANEQAGGQNQLDPALLLPLIWQKLTRTGLFFLLISALFVAALFLRLNRVQKDRLAKLESLNEQLNAQQVQARQGRQALVSLNDDLRLARLEAEGLAKKLSRLNTNLAARNSEMERFIYTISHDLRAPLVTIGGHLQLIARELSDEKLLFRLERAHLSLRYMERLLEDLLLLSRTIHQEFSAKTVRCEEVITPLSNMFSHQISDKCGGMKVELHATEIYCNPRQLSQALQNLISNAIKYADPDRALEIEVETTESETETIVLVRDNGIGIEAAHHDQIFEVFETLQEGEGTGVGLAIVKSIMDKHGGKVFLDSTPGVGSEFKLRFPKP